MITKITDIPTNTPSTIFLDIDGCIITHRGQAIATSKCPILLPNIQKEMLTWLRSGHTIVITTGRKESLRKKTEEELQDLGITYNHLIMGLPRGPRIVINDKKPDIDIIEVGTKHAAGAIELTRDSGF